MLRKALVRSMAQEIRHNMVRELRVDQAVPGPATGSIADLLLKRLAEEVLSQIRSESDEAETAIDLEARLSSLETTVQKLAEGDLDEAEDEAGEEAEDEAEDEDGGPGSFLPNLKYAKPKYKDVQSVLKYIESDGDNGGLKLVIMNFND